MATDVVFYLHFYEYPKLFCAKRLWLRLAPGGFKISLRDVFNRMYEPRRTTAFYWRNEGESLAFVLAGLLRTDH